MHKINLRKSPHNVKEWISLSKLYAKDNKSEDSLKVLEEALEKIDPKNVTEGKLSDVVL